MSRFFIAGYDLGSSSEEEDLLSSEEELLESTDSEFGDLSDSDSEFGSDSDSDSDNGSIKATGPAYFLKKAFLKSGGDDDDSDDENEGKKAIKSAKEKLLDEVQDAINQINIAKRSNTFTTVLTEFDRLSRLIIRSIQQAIGIPNDYIKTLAGLDDCIVEVGENQKSEKTLNALEAKAFNTVRQRVKKSIKDNLQLFELFRQNPDLFDEEDPVDLISYDQDETDKLTTTKKLSPVFTTLKNISESRGKKNINKDDQVQSLETLLEKTVNSGTIFELISIYQMLLSIRFDASSNQSFMPLDQWKLNQDDLNALLDLLESNIDSYQLSELGQTTDDIDIEPGVNSDNIRIIFGSIASLIDRLDDEFTKSLQNTDPHSIEYIERLKDESKIYKLIVRGQFYIESVTPENLRSTTEQLPRIVARRLEHIYYKPNQLISANESAAWLDVDTDSSIVSKKSSPEELINGLTSFLNSHSNSLYSNQAIVYSIYYYAVNNNYHKSRDLFNGSQISEIIHDLESDLQIQYNRALVQLGLSAFRAGSIEESHKILQEMVNSQRSKELLGQGFNTKYPSQATTVEKQKLLPFHQHINLELLECVFMTGSLLLEIPALAQSSNSTKDSKRKSSVKSFRSKLEFHDRQYFTGPPESIKDHIIYASIALQKGDWLKAYDLLSSIKIWNLFPDHDKLLEMMKAQLQVEGLRTYIFTYKSIFTKLSIEKLSTIFKLSKEEIISILQKSIELGEVEGTIDSDQRFINFESDKQQRSKLQELAFVLNEKLQLLNEKNEKTRSNGYGKKSQQQQQNQKLNEQLQQKDLQEESKYRFANVNANNDEFQATA